MMMLLMILMLILMIMLMVMIAIMMVMVMVMMLTMMLFMLFAIMLIILMTMMMMIIPPSKHLAVLDDNIFSLSRHIQVRPTFAWNLILSFFILIITLILIILSSYHHVYKSKLSRRMYTRKTQTCMKFDQPDFFLCCFLFIFIFRCSSHIMSANF